MSVLTKLQDNILNMNNGHHHAEGTVKSCLAELNAAEELEEQEPVEESARYRLMASLHAAAEDLETPHDSILRYVEAARTTAMVVIGGDLGIFKALAQSKTPLSTAELTRRSKAEATLMSRLLRYMAATRIISEAGQDLWVANKKTRVWADPRWEEPIRFFHTVSNPASQYLPAFLKQTGYKNETATTAFQMAFNTHLDVYPWLKEHPESLVHFQATMRMGQNTNGIEVMDFDQSATIASDKMMFVDMGGNTGHQAAAVLEKYPELAGRVMVQDRDEVIKCAPSTKGIHFMAHDIFTPQPVKGAKYYYLRAILHNWTDEETVQILSNIVPAMSADSLIAIDELVVPDQNAQLWPVSLDIQMYALFKAMERTASQWDALFDQAGLRTVAVRKYANATQHAVILAARK